MSTVKRRESWGLFEWDSHKAVANERKHGIRFEDACEVFNDPYHAFKDASVQAEERVGIVGYSPSARPIHPLYVVPHQRVRDNNETETPQSAIS